ncbi:MAG: CHAT domain-containing protein [Ignavibacteriaceae bacterium]
MHKKTILIIIFCLTALSAQNITSPGISIDSIRNKIKTHGWENTLLDSYKNYLLNVKIVDNNEIRFLNQIPGSFQKNYLKALILKRHNKYEEMFKILYPDIKLNPNYLPFYNELVFAAVACGKDSLLLSYVSSSKIIAQQNKNYLMALINSARGNYSAELQFLNEAMPFYKHDKYFLYKISYAYRNLGNYAEAFKSIRDALKYSSSNDFFSIKAYLAAGSLYYLSNEYKMADGLYIKAYKLSIKSKDNLDEATALVDLGIMDDQSGNVDNARDNYLKAAAISDEYGDIETNAFAYSELGVSYSLTGDLLKAKDNYKKSYSLYKQIGGRLRLSLLSDNLARLYMGQFNYGEAERLYKEGLRLAGENKRGQVINLIGLADVHSNLSDYAKAIEYYRKAETISAEIKDIPLEMEINSGIGSVNYNLGNYNNAYKEFNKSLSLSHEIHDVYSMTDLCHKMGLIYSRLDSLDKAKEYFTQAVQLSTKYSIAYIKALSLIDLASLSFNQNDAGGIEKLITESKIISVKNKFNYLEAAALLLQGRVKEKSIKYREAEKIYLNAFRIVKGLKEPNITIELNYLLAGLYERMSRYDKAEKYYMSAIKIIDRISYSIYSKDEIQIEYFAGKNKVYRNYIDLLLNEEKYVRAFEMIDHSRSRNTLQSLVNLKIESIITDKNIVNKLYDFQWKLNSGFYNAADIDSIKFEYDNFKEKLITKFPEIRGLLSINSIKSISEIQKNMSDDETFITFYTTKRNNYAFLIGRDDFKPIKENVSRSELLEIMHEISPYFNSKGKSDKIFYNQDLFSFNSKSSNKLYKIILEHILSSVPHERKIIFSLSPELVVLPMEFLVTDLNNSGSPFDYKNNKYLIDDYQISYTPSIELYIKEKLNNLKNDGNVLLVGNPEFKNYRFGFSESRGFIEDKGLPLNIPLLPLKYSGKEINEISRLIHVNKILTDKEANETNFLKDAPLSKVIHISTHSILLKMQPVIFLSNYDTKGNDQLGTADIVKLKLNSDLVVLSSCSSGLGMIDKAEGIIGMTKAFYEAGAKSVVVSLWMVDDKYTSNFMGLFYSNLSKGMNKSEALRQAKISFIHNYSANPYYWGAFVLSGNTSTINIEPRMNKYTLILLIAGLIILILLFIYHNPWKFRKSKLTKTI